MCLRVVCIWLWVSLLLSLLEKIRTENPLLSPAARTSLIYPSPATSASVPGLPSLPQAAVSPPVVRTQAADSPAGQPCPALVGRGSTAGADSLTGPFLPDLTGSGGVWIIRVLSMAVGGRAVEGGYIGRRGWIAVSPSLPLHLSPSILFSSIEYISPSLPHGKQSIAAWQSDQGVSPKLSRLDVVGPGNLLRDTKCVRYGTGVYRVGVGLAASVVGISLGALFAPLWASRHGCIAFSIGIRISVYECQTDTRRCTTQTKALESG